MSQLAGTSLTKPERASPVKNTEQFHNRIRENFGELYGLDGVEWPGTREKVTIVFRLQCPFE